MNRASLPSATCQTTTRVVAAQRPFQFRGNVYKTDNLEKEVVSCVVKTYWEQYKEIDIKGYQGQCKSRVR